MQWKTKICSIELKLWKSRN